MTAAHEEKEERKRLFSLNSGFVGRFVGGGKALFKLWSENTHACQSVQGVRGKGEKKGSAE